MTLRQRFDDFARAYAWTHFILGSLAFLTIATLFEFFVQRTNGHASAAFMSAAVFSVEVLGAGLAIGLVFAGVRRLIYRQEQLVEMRETALWIACMFGIVCV